MSTGASNDATDIERSHDAQRLVVEFAAELRTLRERSGKSLRELQQSTFASDSSLSRYLSGQTLPPWQVVEALCRLGGRDPDELRSAWENVRGARRGQSRTARESPRAHREAVRARPEAVRADVAVVPAGQGEGSAGSTARPAPTRFRAGRPTARPLCGLFAAVVVSVVVVLVYRRRAGGATAPASISPVMFGAPSRPRA